MVGGPHALVMPLSEWGTWSVWGERLERGELNMVELFLWAPELGPAHLSAWSLGGFRWSCQLLTFPSILCAAAVVGAFTGLCMV